MDTLEQARAEIDAVDAQLAALFERRMAAVLSVAQYKQAHGLPIFDAAREAVVLEKAAARIQNAALRPYYKDHVQNMMDVAKQYEAAVPYIEQRRLAPWTHNKTIRKAIESYRITDEQKAYLRTLAIRE